MKIKELIRKWSSFGLGVLKSCLSNNRQDWPTFSFYTVPVSQQRQSNKNQTMSFCTYVYLHVCGHWTLNLSHVQTSFKPFVSVRLFKILRVL